MGNKTDCFPSVHTTTAFGRQGPEVQILSPRPLTDWFITLSTVVNACFIYISSGNKVFAALALLRNLKVLGIFNLRETIIIWLRTDVQVGQKAL